MPTDYTIDDLYEDGTLKPGLGLLLANLFLARQILYGPISLLASRRSRASSGAEIDMSWLVVNSLWELAVCLPALLVFILLFKRKPGASNWVVSGWSRGREIMLAGALAQTALLIALLVTEVVATSAPMLVVLILQVYVLIYIFQSRRIKDVFSMFPAAQS